MCVRVYAHACVCVEAVSGGISVGTKLGYYSTCEMQRVNGNSQTISKDG